mgnify:FL=1
MLIVKIKIRSMIAMVGSMLQPKLSIDPSCGGE